MPLFKCSTKAKFPVHSIRQVTCFAINEMKTKRSCFFPPLECTVNAFVRKLYKLFQDYLNYELPIIYRKEFVHVQIVNEEIGQMNMMENKSHSTQSELSHATKEAQFDN
ncbi:hypothetical protein ACJMK2_000979 [Sinanodonta woodiana]|uniref:Uncharacterized protein n=1 Tax=Sinanodonta woodiana TaxID=1069815 RepID=A0ABD3XQW3_SINWO